MGQSRRLRPLCRAIVSARLLGSAAPPRHGGFRERHRARCACAGARRFRGRLPGDARLQQHDDGRPLVILYVGDFDPSGMFMSEADLPNRFAKYGGDHITLRRIALTRQHVNGLLSFPATDKRKDPRFAWFVKNHGKRCWELDAMDPNALRACVKSEIKKLIEPVAWRRCETVNRAERESLKTIIA